MTGMTINAAALAAQQSAANHRAKADDAVATASTGKMHTTPSKDAAGRSIALKIAADISSMVQARKNVSQASSMVNVAAAGVRNVADALVRMKALATQVQNGTLDSAAVGFAANEFATLRDTIANTVTSTRFNGTQLLNNTSVTLGASAGTTGITGATFTAATHKADYTIAYATATATTGTLTVTWTDNGEANSLATAISGTTGTAQTISLTNGLSIQLGTAFNYGADSAGGDDTIDLTGAASPIVIQTGEEASTDTQSITMPDLSLSNLSLVGATLNAANAATMSDTIKNAINTLNDAQSSIGANQKALEFTSDRLATAIENLKGAKASFEEADVAEAMTEHALADVGAKASYAMLAKANAATADLLQLMH